MDNQLTASEIEELRELHANASGGTWQSDLNGLYVTTDECPLCTPKKLSKAERGGMGFMVTSAPVSLDEEDKELIQIRGWGHLQKHKDGERVQQANADLIAAMHNNLPALLSAATRCLELEEQVKIARDVLTTLWVDYEEPNAEYALKQMELVAQGCSATPLPEGTTNAKD